MSSEQQNPSAAPPYNEQMKGYVYSLPSYSMQNPGKPNMLLSSTFTYWSLSAGIGLVVMGSLLTYIFHDQAPYTKDPFRSSLQVTLIIFIIIGILLIISSLIKIISMAIKHNESEGEGCFFCPDEASDNDVKNNPLMSDNTIVYNPFNPPILVPYNMVNAPFPGNQRPLSTMAHFPEHFQRDANFSYLPGSTVMGENREKEDGVTDVGQPKPDIFVLENFNEKVGKEEDVAQTATDDDDDNDDEDQKSNDEKPIIDKGDMSTAKY